MIHDTLDNSILYVSVHPGFDSAFAFLRRDDLGELPDGRCEIDGDRVYAIVARAKGRGPERSPLETHDRYIDVQFVLGGADRMGWQHRARAGTSRGYDPHADLELYEGAPAHFLDVNAAELAVFFPHDAHAPLAGEGDVHKVVVKVAVDAGEDRGLVGDQ